MRKTRRNLSSRSLPVVREGRGGGVERDKRGVDMSASIKPHDNKGATVVMSGGHRRGGERNKRIVEMSKPEKTNGSKGATVVVSGGHNICDNKGGSLPIVEKTGESSTSIAMKRGYVSCEHGKKKRRKIADLNAAVVQNSMKYSFCNNTDDVRILEHVNSPRTPVEGNPSHAMPSLFTPLVRVCACDIKIRIDSIIHTSLHFFSGFIQQAQKFIGMLK